jgi:hypothetical protein
VRVEVLDGNPKYSSQKRDRKDKRMVNRG